MYRTAIAPIIAVLALVFHAITGIEVEEDMQAQITTGIVSLIAGVVSIYGIYKTHDKKSKKEEK